MVDIAYKIKYSAIAEYIRREVLAALTRLGANDQSTALPLSALFPSLPTGLLEGRFIYVGEPELHLPPIPSMVVEKTGCSANEEAFILAFPLIVDVDQSIDGDVVAYLDGWYGATVTIDVLPRSSSPPFTRCLAQDDPETGARVSTWLAELGWECSSRVIPLALTIEVVPRGWLRVDSVPPEFVRNQPAISDAIVNALDQGIRAVTALDIDFDLPMSLPGGRDAFSVGLQADHVDSGMPLSAEEIYPIAGIWIGIEFCSPSSRSDSTMCALPAWFHDDRLQQLAFRSAGADFIGIVHRTAIEKLLRIVRMRAPEQFPDSYPVDGLTFEIEWEVRLVPGGLGYQAFHDVVDENGVPVPDPVTGEPWTTGYGIPDSDTVAGRIEFWAHAHAEPLPGVDKYVHVPFLVAVTTDDQGRLRLRPFKPQEYEVFSEEERAVIHSDVPQERWHANLRFRWMVWDKAYDRVYGMLEDNVDQLRETLFPSADGAGGLFVSMDRDSIWLSASVGRTYFPPPRATVPLAYLEIRRAAVEASARTGASDYPSIGDTRPLPSATGAQYIAELIRDRLGESVVADLWLLSDDFWAQFGPYVEIWRRYCARRLYADVYLLMYKTTGQSQVWVQSAADVKRYTATESTTSLGYYQEALLAGRIDLNLGRLGAMREGFHAARLDATGIYDATSFCLYSEAEGKPDLSVDKVSSMIANPGGEYVIERTVVAGFEGGRVEYQGIEFEEVAVVSPRPVRVRAVVGWTEFYSSLFNLDGMLAALPEEIERERERRRLLNEVWRLRVETARRGKWLMKGPPRVGPVLRGEALRLEQQVLEGAYTTVLQAGGGLTVSNSEKKSLLESAGRVAGWVTREMGASGGKRDGGPLAAGEEQQRVLAAGAKGGGELGVRGRG